MESKNIVIGTIGLDPHIVGVRVLTYVLTKAGFKVTSIGALNSQEDFIHAAIETNADAILVSSLYGMAMAASECEGFRDKCVEVGLKDIFLYIGGNLESQGFEWETVEKKFKDFGFDRVYPSNTSLDTAIADLKKDLQLASQ